MGIIDDEVISITDDEVVSIIVEEGISFIDENYVSFIDKEDLIECGELCFGQKNIEYELNKLYCEKNNQTACKYMGYNYLNKINCWCCDNYIVIHQVNIDNFIKKYFFNDKNTNDKNTNDKNNQVNKEILSLKKQELFLGVPEKNKVFTCETRPSSKLIKILYRLHPEYFEYCDITKIRCLKNINKSYLSDDSYKYIFDNYFKSSEDNLSFNMDYYACSICQTNLCLTHMIFNPYYSSKCLYCNKYWNICLWCKHQSMTTLFDKKNNKLLYMKSLCNIFHK